MKILHNASSWLPMTQSWMYTQIKYLPKGFDTLISCNSIENLDAYGDVAPIRCLKNEISAPEYVFRRLLRKVRMRRELGWLKKPLHEFQPDLVHSHFCHVGWATLPEIPNNIEHVLTVYGFDISLLPQAFPRWRERYKDLFERVAGVLCEGAHMASCVENLGCPTEKLFIQRLGIPLDRIPYVPREWEGQGPLRVLLAGTFMEKKGLPYAVRALGKLAQLVPLEVTIIGDARASADSQAEKQKIRAAAHESRISDSISFLGYQPHVRLFEEAYRHHVFLSPSVTAQSGDTEGGAPVTIVEMAATGMPVVSTRHCDIPEVILDGQTGLLAEERDVDGIFDRLRWLVDNPDKWRSMLDGGRKHLEANFCAQKQGLRLAGIYRQLGACRSS